ncbi:MAG: AAA family ATPase [Ktedonobacterales bacterium]|nr:AAA family ATPase [Ktedonobacterales bacterium]
MLLMEIAALDWTFPACPAPPDWLVDWDALATRFAWLRALAGVPQDAHHHAEGDVSIHTRMVVGALAADPAWRALGATERAVVFAAALLHDVAKPACTRVEVDGHITSARHARVGATMAHALLWEAVGLAEPVPLAIRLAIAGIVRHHGLPLWFWDKDDPIRAVLAASYAARLDWVALVAEADVRGRICADQADLLDRVALFRGYSHEQGCAAAPRSFASDHSRFVYFARAGGSPDYAAYDATVCEVILLSGLPGAGKDTWVREQAPDWPVISLDGLRREMGVAPTEPQGTVIHAAREQARELLRRQQSFIWNATNLTRALRGQLITLFADYGARVRIVYLDAPAAVISARNRARAHPVPEAVIRRMVAKLEVPDGTEAHSVVYLTSNALAGTS